ncbi:zinc transporter ZntB [Sphingomonas koreensis]|nr:zinc transporter ZntB [Sphingomonas koreensis]
MSHFAYHVTGGKGSRISAEQALEADGGLVWIHLATNNAEAQQWLADKAGLDDYIIDSLTATETRPRCDAVGDGAFLNMRGRIAENGDEDDADALGSVRIWATAGRVISVTRKKLTALEQVIAAVESAEADDPGDLITEFATAITEELDPEVADLGDELDDCEADLDADRVFQLRRAVTHVRVVAIQYRRFLTPQRAALEKLAALPCDWLEDDDRLHLAAAADRAARMAEELESIRERAALMHEALTDLRAEQIDSRALLISIVAMIFLPLTFLTGLLGMNVKGIPYAQEPWAFDGVMGVCAAIAAGITIYFLRRHWFR